jgi:hypothetical protein
VPFSRRELLELLRRGRIVGVEFTKRDGSTRRMAARSGVKSHLRGGRLNYSPEDHDLIVVFDMNKRAYRQVPCDRIHRVSAGGSVVYSELPVDGLELPRAPVARVSSGDQTGSSTNTVGH